MAERVVVRAPATVANLGPGFDCLGVALSWFNEVRVDLAPPGELTVAAAGAGADAVPAGEDNLTVRALRALLGPEVGLRVRSKNAIPFGRGFGSSAAAIAAGLVAGGALGGESGRPPLEIAAEMEGHPDNVAPCLLGGAVVVGPGGAIRLGAPARLRVLVCVAPGEFATGAARAALPEWIPFGDAVASVGRAARLVAALATGEHEALLEATGDTLHQPARFALMPDSGALVAALRTQGIAAFLSGAGPSVAAFVPAEGAAEADAAAHRLAPDGWMVRLETIEKRGARVVRGLGGSTVEGERAGS